MGSDGEASEHDRLEAMRSAKSRGEDQRLAEEAERIADTAQAASSSSAWLTRVLALPSIDPEADGSEMDWLEAMSPD